MSKELVAKLRSGFITDACGIPLRGSTEKIMDEAADLVESQAKELDKAETVISFSLAAIDSLKKELAEAQARELTDEEIDLLWLSLSIDGGNGKDFARSVIAADRAEYDKVKQS